MASIFSHIAVPIGIALALGKRRVPKTLLEAGVISAIAPDVDCAAFAFGIPYQSQFGHRGFMHSIVFALAFAALWAWRQKEFNVPRWGVFAYTFACIMSHPLIDAMTDGGLGIAFFWPFSAERYFFPWRFIPVSPIGGSFFSARGLEVITAELGLIWLPCLALGMLGFFIRKFVLKEKPISCSG